MLFCRGLFWGHQAFSCLPFAFFLYGRDFFVSFFVNGKYNTAVFLSLSLTWIRLPSRACSDAGPGVVLRSGGVWVCVTRQVSKTPYISTRHHVHSSLNAWSTMLPFFWLFCILLNACVHAYVRLHLLVCFASNMGKLSMKNSDDIVKLTASSITYNTFDSDLWADSSYKQPCCHPQTKGGTFYLQNSMQNFMPGTCSAKKKRASCPRIEPRIDFFSRAAPNEFNCP